LQIEIGILSLIVQNVQFATKSSSDFSIYFY